MFLLHPIVVHFAIALLSVAVVLDFLHLISKKENFRQISTYLLVIGTVSSIAAVITGHQAFDVVEVSGEVKAMVLDHRDSGMITMWLFIGLTLMRFLCLRLGWFEKKVKWVYYGVGLAAVIFLFRTGLLGGEMVYFHGVGIQKDRLPPASKPSFEE